MDDVQTIRRRNLLALIEERFSGSRAAFARKMGWNPSLVSRLLTQDQKQRQNVGTRMARSIETEVGIPRNWMDSAHAKADILGVKQRSAAYNVAAGPQIQRQVPLISWVQAGRWMEIVDQFHAGDAEKWISTTARVGPHAYALRVVGDSMTNPIGAPSFPEGTIIIVDPQREPEPGRFVIARQKHDEECTFKQLVRDAGRWYLKPLNPRYPILELAADSAVVGIVVQAIMEV